MLPPPPSRIGLCFEVLSIAQSQLVYSPETFEKVSLFTQLSEVLVELRILFQNGTFTDLLPNDIKTSKFYPYYTGLTAQIVINKYVEETAYKGILMWLK